MAAQKRQRPLIRYAGSAAETSIRSKPIGRELNTKVYSKRHFCQASLAMAQSRTSCRPCAKLPSQKPEKTT